MSSMPSRTHGARRAVIVACAALCGGASLAAAPQPDQPAPRGVLELRGGGFVAGEFVPAPEATGGRETLPWQSPAFSTPFDFRLADVTGVRCGTKSDAAPAPAESFRLHLRGGDVIVGMVEAIDADTITIDAADGAGRQSLRIRRDEVESISRPAAGRSSFEGPGGLAGWTQSPADAWREEAGRLLSSRRGASVSRDLAAPARARYDVAVSWVDAAEFRLSLTSAGGGDDDGFWLELLRPVAGEPTLAVVRRQAGRALLEPIPLDRDVESVRLSLFVDQSLGRMAVVLPTTADRPVVDITLARGEKPEPLPGVRLAVTSGGICLESLRVAPWTAAEPTLDEGGGTTIAVRAGATRRCDLEGFDANAKAFIVREAGQVTRIPVADVTAISLPRPAATGAVQPPQVRAIDVDGDGVSGSLLKVDAHGVWIRRTGVAEPVRMSFARLAAMQSLVPSATAAEVAGREGRLQGEGIAMRGALTQVDGGVGWQPVGSVVAAPFAANTVPFSGRLDYVAPQAENEPEAVGGIGGMVGRAADDAGFVVTMLAEDGAAAQDGRMQPGDQIVAIAPTEKSRFVPAKDLDPEEVTDLLRGPVGSQVRIQVTDHAGENPRQIDLVRRRLAIVAGPLLRQALQTHAKLAAPQSIGDGVPFPAVVVLASGESTPCRVVAIDAERLRLVTPLAGTDEQPVDVPAALVKAVELTPSSPVRPLDRVRFERLLTIPRMQRSRPPTHVLRMKNGDYVRGRLVAVDDVNVRIELPGKEQVFPRETVTRVIWLHPEEVEPRSDAAVADPPRPDGLTVTGVWPGGRRMVLSVAAVEDRMLLGTNPALGAVRIDTDTVDRLLFGAEAEHAAGRRPYSQWTPRPAPGPRALQTQEAAQGAAGD
jgi:hypothetical protein